MSVHVLARERSSLRTHRARAARSLSHLITIPVAVLIVALFFGAAPFRAGAQMIAFTSVPNGYEPGSIPLPAPFTGALAADPNNVHHVYASVGGFANNQIVRINLTSSVVMQVAAGPFGSVAGLAVLPSGQLVIVESGSAAGGPPDDTILIATDNNPADGDFDDPGEITELIPPILVNNNPPFFSGFTGAQARVAPAGDPSGIPTGSVLIQTADGGGEAELLVIEDPMTTPTAHFRPLNDAYHTGFDFNGGFDFDSSGRIMMGTLEGTFFTGEVFALVNLDSNDFISSPTESNRIIAGENGMADLTIDGEDDVFFAGYDQSFIPTIRQFEIPSSPLTQTATPTSFAQIDSSFLTGLLINSKSLGFEPYGGAGGATMLIGGYDALFAPATNLLTLRPVAPSAVEAWDLYP